MAGLRMGVGVSVSEFARMVGVSQPYISKLLSKKKLPRNKDGTIPEKEGLSAYRMLKNIKPDFPIEKSEAEINRENEKIIVNDGDKAKRYVPPSNDFESGGQDDEKIMLSSAYKKAMLAEKTFNAKIKEIEYKVKKGEVLQLEEAKLELKETGIQLKNRLMAIPSRISSICENKNAREIEKILENEISDALRELAKSRFLSENEKDY
jgi:transcriptional regulator with XRE-family HTH domain